MLLCVVFRSCFLCNILYLGTNMCDTPCKYIFNPKILRLLSSNSLLVEGFKLLCLWIEMEDFQAYHWKEKFSLFILHLLLVSSLMSFNCPHFFIYFFLNITSEIKTEWMRMWLKFCSFIAYTEVSTVSESGVAHFLTLW